MWRLTERVPAVSPPHPLTLPHTYLAFSMACPLPAPPTKLFKLRLPPLAFSMGCLSFVFALSPPHLHTSPTLLPPLTLRAFSTGCRSERLAYPE